MDPSTAEYYNILTETYKGSTYIESTNTESRKNRRTDKSFKNPVNCKSPFDMSALVSGKDKTESITFTFSKVEKGNVVELMKYGKKYVKLEDIIKHNKKIYSASDKIMLCSNRENTIRAPYSNGIMGAIQTAYSKHIPLILRPDDIWIAICVIFGNYVSNNSEEMRNCFVEHSGRKELRVYVNGPPLEFVTENMMHGFIGEFEKEIRKNVTDGITEWMKPTFSTTTFRDQLVSNVVLMGTLKEYFSYNMMICCGFSEITLEGTKEDWINLVEKARYLYSFNQKDLTNWADLLIPVLEEFAKAYEGKVDEDFWQRACTNQTYGSGAEIFRGWFLVFSPFDDKGKYLLNPKNIVDSTHVYGEVDDGDIMDCIISTELTIEDHTEVCGPFANQNGQKYECVLFGGSLLLNVDTEKNNIKPFVDWGLIIKKEATIEDMLEYMRDKIKGYTKEFDKTMEKCEYLTKFACFASSFYNIPKNAMYDLSEQIISFCLWDGMGSSMANDEQLFKQFLKSIGGCELVLEGRDFTKYIVFDEIEDCISEYRDENKKNEIVQS